jgi:pyrroline-5-carboxylate reductase
VTGETPILLIGAGKMGQALIRGWLKRGIGPIFAVEPTPSPGLHSEYNQLVHFQSNINQTFRNRVLLPKLAACVIAVKPQILKTYARALAPIAKNRLMISIAAGTHSEFLAGVWGHKARIIRAMPNTPGAIGHGITGLYAAKGATVRDRKMADRLLSALGKTIWVKNEQLIDVVTAVSGSGPAYLFLMAEALTRAGVAEGLPYETAVQLARATVAGAGALLDRDKHAAATLRKAVTSPGGTTEAALKVLMAKDGLPALMKRAVHAARKRAEELR